MRQVLTGIWKWRWVVPIYVVVLVMPIGPWKAWPAEERTPALCVSACVLDVCSVKGRR